MTKEKSQIQEILEVNENKPKFFFSTTLNNLLLLEDNTWQDNFRPQWGITIRRTAQEGSALKKIHVRFSVHTKEQLANYKCRVVFVRVAVMVHAISAIIEKDSHTVTLIDSNANPGSIFTEAQTLACFALACILPGGFTFKRPPEPMCQKALLTLLKGSCYMWANIQNEMAARHGITLAAEALTCMRQQFDRVKRADILRAY